MDAEQKTPAAPEASELPQSEYSALELLELAPSGMVGWLDEAAIGPELVITGPGDLRVKLIAREGRVVAFALAERAGEARELLLRIGFQPRQIRRMLCG